MDSVRWTHASSSPAVVTAAWMLLVAAATTALVPILSGPSGVTVLLATLGAVALGLVLWQPCVGVAAILVVWMSDFSPALYGARFLSVPYTMTCMLLVPLGLVLARERKVRVLSVPQVRLLLAIGAAHVLSTCWNEIVSPVAGEGDETGRRLVVFASRLLFVVFFYYFASTRRRIEAMTWLIVAVIVAAAVTSWGPILAGSAARAEAWLLDQNANRLALICMFATAILWCARSEGRDPRWRALALPFLLVLPATALASGSRSGFLQVGVLGVLAVAEQPPQRRIRSLALLGCGALLVAAVVPEALLARSMRFDTSVSAPGGESMQERIWQHWAAVRIVLQHPILGVGIGNFEPIAAAAFHVRNTLHNSFLLALIEGGPLVLGLHLGLFVVTWRELRRLQRERIGDLAWLAKGLRFSLALFLVASATADLWLSEMVYVIFGLTIALAALPPATSHERRHS